MHHPGAIFIIKMYSQKIQSDNSEVYMFTSKQACSDCVKSFKRTLYLQDYKKKYDS